MRTNIYSCLESYFHKLFPQPTRLGEAMNKVAINRAIYGNHGNPLDYPGRIIARPVFVSNGYAIELGCSDDFLTFTTAKGDSLERILHQRGVPQIQDRVAQIAFGANRNLENIAWKFRNYHHADHAVNQDFIALPAFLHNADVVACNIGYWGYIYGGLLTGTPEGNFRPYLNETWCPVTLLLLDTSQLAAVHRSEGVVMPGQARPGVSCAVSDMDVHLSDSVTCRAQVYSLSVPFLSFDGKKPIAFETVKTRGRGDYPALSQQEIFLQINRLLHAEPFSAGRVPIAETLAEENARLLRDGALSTRRMSGNALYTSVRNALIENYSLRDSDGKIRCGLEDIYPIRTEKTGWEATPKFFPVQGGSAEPASMPPSP
jgi:hypothetical protein